MKKVAIMQPYFMPYLGYWQLIASVDEFVVYDNIEYTKKGWFNRNRILEIDHDRLFTIPIKKDSDYLPVNKRYLSEDSGSEVARILRVIQTNYRKAPNFEAVFPIIESCFLFSDKNLFAYNYNAIKTVCNYLDITTPITVSSTIDIDHSLRAAQKVLALSKATNADVYINAIGGIELYDKTEFAEQGIDLKFIKAQLVEYPQLGSEFVPWLSIIDVMMFNDKVEAKRMLLAYDLV